MSTGITTPASAASRAAAGLGVLALGEVGGVVIIGALAGQGTRAIAGAAVALAIAGAVRVTAAAMMIGTQRILHRAARADTELDRFAPSPRVIVLAERAPLALAALTVLLAPLFAVALSAPALLALALAMLGLAPAAMLARAPIERWIARLPARDLPDRSSRGTAMEAGVLGAAPVLGCGLLALALAPLSGWALLALVPAAVIAALEASASISAQRELDALAPRLDALERTPSGEVASPIALQSDAARGAWAEVQADLDAASAELRAETDAQRAIEHQEQVRSRFMAAMGHELRSPLNSIVGFAQLLEEGADGPLTPGQHESVVMVRRSAQELLRLLTDILDSARLDAGRLRLKRAWTPSVEIVTEAARIGRSVVEGHAVQIEEQVQPGMPPVHVDRARIVQAVAATFRHAARGKSSGALELRARTGLAPDGVASLLVEVRDASRVMTAEERERVFDPFGQLRDAASGRRMGGLGLALALARKLVRLHGGDVWAESRAPEGTRYVVSVPLAGPRSET